MTEITEGFDDGPPEATKLNNLWTPEDYQAFVDFCEGYTETELDFVFGRDFRTVLRDGAVRTFSKEMLQQLGRMLVIFTATRTRQFWQQSGKAPQRLRVRFSVELAEQPIDPDDDSWVNFDYGNPV